jgi:hypothetical protein
MDDLPEPLGEILGRALEAREAVQQALAPVAETSGLIDLAKRDTADAYVAARRRESSRR